jgi:hypothetical protein
MKNIGDSVSFLAVTRGIGCPAWQRTVARWRDGEHWTYVELAGFSDISQARSALASEWLAHWGTHWALWLDDDIEIAWDDLILFVQRAIESPYEMICANYAGKTPGGGLLTTRFKDTTGVVLGDGGGYYPVLGCGFGCVMVRASAFHTIAAHLPLVRWERPACIGRPYFLGMIIQDQNDPDGPRVQLGEDYSFCQRARACRTEIVCDTRTRLWHHGDYRYGVEDADAMLQRFERLEVSAMKRCESSNAYPSELAEDLGRIIAGAKGNVE